MALSHLIKYVYNTGSDEVIRRGKKIHAIGYVEMVEHDELMNSIVFRVKDDTYSTFYKVAVEKYNDPQALSLRCGCPYNLGDICRHEVAALFKLQELIDKNLLGSSNLQYSQLHTVAKMKNIELKVIRVLSSPEILEAAETSVLTNKAKIIVAANERIEAELDYEGQTYPLVIQKNDERNFDTSCKCDETAHPLCVHKIILFLQLLQTYGPYYFDSIRNWDKEKNKLLQIYGYNLTDDLNGKFEFVYKDGKPFLKVLDTNIKRVAAVAPVERPSYMHEAPRVQPEVATIEVPVKKLGLIFNFNTTTYPGFLVDAVQGEADDDNKKLLGKIEKLDLTKYVNTELFTEEDKMLLQQIRKLQAAEINKYLNRNSPFSGIWENIIQTDGDEFPEETKLLITEYLQPKLKKLFEEQRDNPFVYYLPQNKAFKTDNLLEVALSDRFIEPQFKIVAKEDYFELQCRFNINGAAQPVTGNECNNSLLFLYNHIFYLWQKAEDVLQAEKFIKNGNIKLSKENWAAQMQKTIMPLTKEYKVEFDKSLVKEIRSGEPEVKLMLQEKGEYLVFQPIFTYQGFETRPSDKETITIPDGDKILIVHRNKEAEQRFTDTLSSLHSQFIQPQEGNSLILKGADVLRNNWFFLFVDAMKESKVPVFGFEALRNFRFNTARPSTHIHVSSGLDWFDAKVEIDFEGQRIGINDIKKALAARQSFVQLADGTLGILPDEWLKRYSLLFKVGDGKNDKLRLSKYHMSVIDELYENRDATELSFALDEKFQRLREYKQIPEIPAPVELQAVLRPYQTAGYQWLNYLNEVGWGGILADDMGLGKTVQALTMLQHYKTQEAGLKAIVICPTTLIYNWENEIKKFTPELTWRIHHGSMRTRDAAELQKVNVVITTYGTLRSDIQTLMKILFDYVVLDESQAIKNPSSKVTKAACLLTAKNRLCMSGTPLQNNTFDIFAQMNFLNPGLLGSMDFFRNEFATPIDKFGEQEQKDHLRKLLYPFILRRTKEQVAKDLPEKTETILFCEMEKEQRKIYDAYRNSYRDKIMGVIDQQGIDKSQLTILQGLMKLRQICDSPAILNEEDKYPNHSIKLDELTREIFENIGEHKALVFSQFLGMLALIREKLTEQGIPYEYFDGSTSITDRQKAIDNFQNNDTCRVFLISLKAGGVGLNLTAADYVYIVDPWWNPAVEQQAIDRTHRIGQTKNIFAYRMICIDTIEDKILQLQERKRKLASELISDDVNFVKALSKADVEYLFS
ncbi:DEAD/DEAH box helicase [Ferruginibacter sp.]|uniref:DEAD/DEAH box helicase n=1 Tax=Ferruginibacter sp. TaxID=1940288 RepID=UPI0019C4C8EC|nr:DEAD/DEAH box helicase [Ferruginibacter sp.]MBC7626476.1 SNF2 helicase associated domain-containing protein [Ferruginibacter sp.]